MINRRKFIRSSVLAGAGLLSGISLSPITGCSSSCDCVQPVRKNKYVLADVHNHIMLNEWNSTTPVAVEIPAIDYFVRTFFDKTDTTLQTAYEAGVDLICVAHFNVFDEWLGMPTDPNPVASINTLRMMDQLEKELNGPGARYARLLRTPKEFKNHFGEPYDKDNPNFRIGILHAIEGGHALGGSLEPLKEFARKGVAIITIGHFYNKGIATAPNAFPFFADANSQRPKQGLSAFGKEVILEMENLGMIVDVTHATSTAMDDILKVSTRPLIATHISSRTLGDHAYSFLDEHIQEIVHRGGMIGIPFYPYVLSNYITVKSAEEYGSLKETVRTIRHVIKISNSTSNVCIGSDFGGFIPRLCDMNCLCQIDMLQELLIKEFSDEKIVEGILAKNTIDFIGNNWQMNI
jgi:microsomal dipeptidase-like Zn-dependent dipeptidase